jgi:hypothetical protein
MWPLTNTNNFFIEVGTINLSVFLKCVAFVTPVRAGGLLGCSVHSFSRNSCTRMHRTDTSSARAIRPPTGYRPVRVGGLDIDTNE